MTQGSPSCVHFFIAKSASGKLYLLEIRDDSRQPLYGEKVHRDDLQYLVRVSIEGRLHSHRKTYIGFASSHFSCDSFRSGILSILTISTSKYRVAFGGIASPAP
jgi:hypothetical protein